MEDKVTSGFVFKIVVLYFLLLLGFVNKNKWLHYDLFENKSTKMATKQVDPTIKEKNTQFEPNLFFDYK